MYSADQNLTDIKLLLAPPSGSISHAVLAPFEDHLVVNTTKHVWQQLVSNKTSVYLHVLLMRSGLSDRDVSITSKTLERGDALHGVVGMVKYDKIPRQFRQRYLLSDFGLVEVSPLEGTKASSI